MTDESLSCMSHLVWCSSLLYSDYDFEKRLPKEKLFVLCRYEPVQKYVRRADYAFYQALVEVLIPDVLRPIPSEFIHHHHQSCCTWFELETTDNTQHLYTLMCMHTCTHMHTPAKGTIKIFLKRCA